MNANESLSIASTVLIIGSAFYAVIRLLIRGNNLDKRADKLNREIKEMTEEIRKLQ